MAFFRLKPEPLTFYVSSLGDDSADGLTPATAWATPAKVTSSALPRSRVLFEEGSVFYGPLTFKYGIEVGSYGAGDSRPTISAYKLLNNAAGWSLHSDGVWKIDLTTSGTHGGYTASNPNIGHLVIDGVIKPARKGAVDSLSASWDFFNDATYLYVAAVANPTTLAASIKAAPKLDLVTMSDNTELHDLEITGSGGHGIRGIGADGVHVHDCLIRNIGGSILSGSTRYGNGIEVWIEGNDWLVEGNEIAEIYDVAFTAQGPGGSWANLTVRDNHIHDCTQSFEFWATGTTGAGFDNILVENNLCERAGGSVMSPVRPDPEVAAHLLTYGWTRPADILVQNNTFDRSTAAYRFHSFTPNGLVSQNNTIKLAAGTKMRYQDSATIETAAAWAAANSTETGSTFVVL